jgi:polyphosphate kinase 2 (PPK2 family)
MNSIKPGEPTFKERVEKMEQFEKMLVNLGIHLDKDKDVAIARE